ncbi:hypothetical protein KUTeg_013783 [Tegillarca granosa]|uniref:Pleckstrin homology domain-containing family G member 1 n=1 Tax=Tegillarca granosa TaxID=220873 RepID=A0ABQ9EV24_TEGGR|nr:hypothetical protein KUTeg_013783 [Tegillarca granosa]
MSQNDDSISSPSKLNISGKSPVVNGTPVRHSSVKDGSGSPKYVTHVQRVVAEIKETERIYVQCLIEIIEGYLNYLVYSPHLKISTGDIDCLFGNIQEIYEFSRQFTEDLEKCEDDPEKVAECFVAHNEGFSIYAQYCTNYPTAVEVLTKVMMDPELSEVFKQQQIKLGHNLPLGAYLLKPNILKNYDKKDPGYKTMSQALDHMTGMAHHINEMKRKHEHAVRVQEIQSQLEDYEGEDLTRLGELVLEGSFRVYGAKTSRHVFLFEKGVLVSKRKEDGMQSCKGFILCSNLMLVESIPKEPLTFQIIPFDNPKGQHTLQARNLEQKRKWCQEIKRLILESYKEKIPEKVKGLVMQLGKSKDEDSVKGEEGKKIHHHTAPEYLERRHRMRRKSGGTLLPDLLKPNRLRKGQRRAESVSPRSFITKIIYYIKILYSLFVNVKKHQELSRVPTDSDLYSWKQNVNPESSPTVTVNQDSPVNRSKSFRIAVKGNPRASGDYAQIDESKEARPVANIPTRRSQSFRQATRMKPLMSVDYEDPEQMHPSLSSPDASLSLQEINKLEELNKECNNQYLSNRVSDHDSVFNNASVHDSNKRSDVSQHEVAGRYSSLPVLTNANNNGSKNFHIPSSSSSSRTFSTESFKTLNSPSQCKRVIDTKQYFSVNKDTSQDYPKYRDQDSCNNNFRREGKSVSAFNDSFLKKSTENLMAKSSKYSQKLGPKSITLTKPLSFTVLKYSSDPIHVSKKENSDNKENVINGDISKCDDEEDPWVPNPSFSSAENLLQAQKPQTRQRAYSADGEIDDFSEENFDWLVYANRNHLPVTGFSSENIPKLYKYCTPPRDSMEPPPCNTNTSSKSQNSVNKPYKTPRLSLIKTYATPPRSAMDPRQMQDYSGVKNHAQLDSAGSSSESEEKSSVGSLPMVGKPPDSHVLEERRQILLKRSMSSPCARHNSYGEAFRRGTRPVSVEVDYIDNDHEKIVAEMEDYMRRSDSNMTLSSSKFPMTITQVAENDKNIDQRNRDSCMSYLSSSSYESQGSYSNNSGAENVVGTIKNKFNDIKQKLAHRRSGSYDNKFSNMSDPEYDSEGEKNRHKNRESGSSLMSLNTWFGGKSKEQQEPDLQSVLLAGELGSASVGQRIAEQEPDYAELNDSLQKIRSHSQQSVDDEEKIKNSSPVQIEQKHVPSLQNLNMQQCDSAFSIQSEINDLTSEESPREDECVTKPKGFQREESCSSAESFYERRLSVAFNEGEVFRDSAVYCEMDIDQQVSTTQELPPKAPRVPIKEYVQYLEEKTKPKESQTKKVKHREPAAIIRQRMESLKSRLEGSNTYSRPTSEERKFLRFHSRPVSEERELTPFNWNISKSNRSSSTSINIISHQGNEEEENKYHEYTDNRRLYRSRSNPPAGGPLRASRSLGRLDQLSNDLDNLVIMKGWVKQLISRFQSNQ